jgi:hypothetical protein
MIRTDRPAPSDEIEITPEMIEAGERVFYREMSVGDYLAVTPRRRHLTETIAAIYGA